MSAQHGGLIWLGNRPLRDIGNAYGLSLKKSALQDLGVVNEDGDLVEDTTAKIVINDDGTIAVDLGLSD